MLVLVGTLSLLALLTLAQDSVASALMYRWTVVPRWLSGWVLLGVAVSLVATLHSGFTQVPIPLAAQNRA